MGDDLLDELNELDELNTPDTRRTTRHELLEAALLHLMSQYTVNSAAAVDCSQDDGPCLKLAPVIERHLNALARLL